MANRRIDAFFYGLFMDLDILREGGVAPVNPRRAYVDGFALRIGQRATLLPLAGARAYGMIFALTHSELERLYAGPGLEQYRPEAVLAQPLEGAPVPALCYNLREAPRPHERNPEYAARLQRALSKLDFPQEYVASISYLCVQQARRGTVMRKRIIRQGPQGPPPADQPWLDVERLAQVEVTSEDPAHPIESALLPGTESGWRAAQPGEQTIRLLFDEPLRLRRICLEFHEQQHARTQEFALRWSPDGGQSYRQLVRQQYNFSPPDTTREVEDYSVSLDRVTALELNIVPDISGGDVRASLARLQLA